MEKRQVQNRDALAVSGFAKFWGFSIAFGPIAVTFSSRRQILRENPIFQWPEAASTVAPSFLFQVIVLLKPETRNSNLVLIVLVPIS